MVDQLSTKWLEAIRDEEICVLHNLDWLRENGTTFTRVFTSNPVCSPTRVTIATGFCSKAHGYCLHRDDRKPYYILSVLKTDTT
jgi:arylsulfatase A-like enzyme